MPVRKPKRTDSGHKAEVTICKAIAMVNALPQTRAMIDAAVHLKHARKHVADYIAKGA